MIPDRNLLRRHCDDLYGSCFSGGGAESYFHGLEGLPPLKPNPSMTDDEPSPAAEVDEQRGSTRRDENDDDTSSSGDWLQLGLATTPPLVAVPGDTPERMAATTRLEFFPGRPPSSSSSSVSPASVTYPVAWSPGGGIRAPVVEMTMTMVPWMSHLRRDMPWGRWNPSLAMGGASSTVVLPPALPEFVARQFMHPISSSSAPSLRPDVRVVSPPRRPQSGVWITLQAMRNQGREPFLPQIPKSFLRIKDGRMTVRLLMKYLVNKLGLEDESEVEMTCRGQLLLPSLTLQHVRDHVWCSRETTALLQDSRSTEHIMMLHYSRSSSYTANSHHLV
ncbi:hypothetical protein Cni_G21644 [Canna indica]|uniref:Uncharacterized protein n=1 Tax=Canna indica TaxID=4628 RepID=A0AAQ3QHI0_9LILI|nr:hypothetical protein Cni_G21644 [Canna indica]